MSDTPQLIATIRKSDDAQIRVHRQVYKGRQVIDVRVFWQQRTSSEFTRSARGITFSEKLLPDLIKALQDAHNPQEKV